jgi:hypothetical protein
MPEKEYIDKDKALNAIECIDISDCTDIDDIFTEVERAIDDLPTADVAEVVHSYWVDKEGKFVPFNEKDGCPARSCYCHRCNNWLTGSDEYPCCGNYCPNCGAKMDLTNS